MLFIDVSKNFAHILDKLFTLGKARSFSHRCDMAVFDCEHRNCGITFNFAKLSKLLAFGIAGGCHPQENCIASNGSSGRLFKFVSKKFAPAAAVFLKNYYQGLAFFLRPRKGCFNICVPFDFAGVAVSTFVFFQAGEIETSFVNKLVARAMRSLRSGASSWLMDIEKISSPGKI